MATDHTSKPPDTTPRPEQPKATKPIDNVPGLRQAKDTVPADRAGPNTECQTRLQKVRETLDPADRAGPNTECQTRLQKVRETLGDWAGKTKTATRVATVGFAILASGLPGSHQGLSENVSAPIEAVTQKKINSNKSSEDQKRAEEAARAAKERGKQYPD